MRKAEIYVNDKLAGILSEIERGRQYRFEYQQNYAGPSVSLTLPTAQGRHDFDRFPPFFDGLLPEGTGLEALLKLAKIDRNDPFGQLVIVGRDLVGFVTVREIPL